MQPRREQKFGHKESPPFVQAEALYAILKGAVLLFPIRVQ